MGFWKSLRALLQEPNILGELDAAREQLRETGRKLDACIAQAETNDILWESQVEKAQGEAHDYRAALLAVSPALSSSEDMKQFYHTIAPYLDKYGFELYRAAKRLTGIDVCGAFPYEDNRGMFEGADGHKLLRYLTATHFHAVEWTVVPGACHEKATLREVDASTPGYQVFEQELYEGALVRLGFQEILRPALERAPEPARDSQTEKKRGDAR